MLPIIRVFVSSPSDVRPERLVVERVIGRLAREYTYHRQIEAVLWEREPLVAAHHFQDIANIPPPRSCDIVLVILWARLGVPLPPDRFKGALSNEAVTGTEWEFEDALAGYRESGLPDLLLYRKRASVAATLDDEAALDEQRRQKRQVEAFLRRWFFDSEARSFTAAFHEFTAAGAFEEMVENHLRALIRRRLEGTSASGPEAAPPRIRYAGAPFRGLLSFEPEHAAVFFGRGRARHDLRELVARQAARGVAFVLVLGASGSGKSSLVKAGLLPDLQLPGMVGRVAVCRHAILRPSDAAGDPVGALAEALLIETALPELRGLAWTAEALRELLATAPHQLATPLHQGLAAAARSAGLTEHGEARLVLIVDQLEELFTQEHLGDADRRAYILALAALARSGLAWVIATMRGDFFDRLGSIPELAELSQGEARYLLPPPTAAEIAQVITSPAREAGCRYEQGQDGIGLDELIRQAAGKDPGALPLLSFLLDQLWRERGPHGTLSYRTYEALGGLEGALGRRAEEVFRALPADAQAALPTLLRALVTVGHGELALPTARTVRLAQFPPGSPARRLVDAMLGADARLLVADGDRDGARVRVAHEALLTNWETARRQIEQDRADLQVRARLEQSAARWLAEQRHPDLLLPPGLLLAEAQDLRQRRESELDEAVLAFIAASEEVAQRLRSEREATEQSFRDEQRKRHEAEIRVLREAAETHKREWQLARGSCLTAIGAILILVLTVIGMYENDQRNSDYQLTQLMPIRPEADARIAVIGLQDTTAMQDEAGKVDYAFLADLLDQIREKGASTVGFGIPLTESGSHESEQALRDALAAFSVPPVVAWSNATQAQEDAQERLYRDLKVVRGQFQLSLDPEGVVRQIDVPSAIDDAVEPFAFAVMRQAGLAPPTTTIWIDYVRRETADLPAVETHHSFDVAGLPPDALKDKIVLVGVTADAGVKYSTPMAAYWGIYAGMMAPIEIHAQVVLQLLEGRALAQPPRLMTPVYLSSALAAIAMLLVSLNWRVRYIVLVPIAYVALWSVATYFEIMPLIWVLPLPWVPVPAFALGWAAGQAVHQFRRALRHRRLARETAQQAVRLQTPADAPRDVIAETEAAPA